MPFEVSVCCNRAIGAGVEAAHEYSIALANNSPRMANSFIECANSFDPMALGLKSL
ncbi:MAG: hypothetical protein ACO3SN_09130 [Burkholderiaceae bacterium]